MKTTNIHTIALVLSISMLTVSCSKDLLDVDPEGTQVETNYYKNPQEAFNGLVAAYDPIGWESDAGSSYANFPTLVAASDECYGGGGSASDVPFLNTMDSYSIDAANGPQLGFWDKNFTGISRVNTIISKLEAGVPGLSDALKNRYIAESRFLRAHYYFDLARLFKNVPLFTEPLAADEIYNVTQASVEDVYAQIEQDLKDALAAAELPDIVDRITEGGRATKGAAHALLGKVYLYEKKWAEAASELAIVNGTPGQANATYGYQLLSNYADIFKVNNKFSSEAVFEISHTTLGGTTWGDVSIAEGMIACQMVGPRSYNGPTYYSGWGGCPISDKLFNDMHGDPRYSATISDIDSLVQLGEATYVPGYQNTGHFVKKFAPLIEFKSTGAGAAPLNYPQNYIEIRLADTYLMEAEALVNAGGDLTRAAALLNAVRARVGLVSVAATLDNIYNERYLELATEGHRWYDLIRTGKAEAVLGPLGFKTGKNELLPIPLPELNNTKLVQNPGY